METTHKLRKPVESRHALRHRQKTLALGVALAVGIAGTLVILLFGCGRGGSAPVVPSPIPGVQALQAPELKNMVPAAVNSVNADMVVPMVDRGGFVLGFFRTKNAPATS